MRLALVAAAMTLPLAAPATAEVLQSFDGRFGVAYTSDPNGGPGQTRTLYQGRYTVALTQRTDNGMTFRFELQVIAGNIPPSDLDRPVLRSMTIGRD